MLKKPWKKQQLRRQLQQRKHQKLRTTRRLKRIQISSQLNSKKPLWKNRNRPKRLKKLHKLKKRWQNKLLKKLNIKRRKHVMLSKKQLRKLHPSQMTPQRNKESSWPRKLQIKQRRQRIRPIVRKQRKRLRPLLLLLKPRSPLNQLLKLMPRQRNNIKRRKQKSMPHVAHALLVEQASKKDIKSYKVFRRNGKLRKPLLKLKIPIRRRGRRIDHLVKLRQKIVLHLVAALPIEL